MPGLQISLFWNTQMFLVASGADVVSDKEVASDFKECERMNGFKPRIRKMQSMQRNSEKA